MFKHIIALVTGGASGLGRATVERLAKNGARVAILDLQKSEGKQVASECGNNVLFTPGDVTSEEDVLQTFNVIEKKFGSTNTVVNCAGTFLSQKTYDDRFEEPHSLDEFRRVLTVNAIGPYNVLRLAGKYLAASKPDEDGQRGVIINTSSMAATEGQLGQVALSASHGALSSMTLPLARDFGVLGVRVVTIAPGLFDTPYLKNISPAVQKSMIAGSLPPRLGKPDEFADLVEHIILNKMLNGCVIRLDAAIRCHI